MNVLHYSFLKNLQVKLHYRYLVFNASGIAAAIFQMYEIEDDIYGTISLPEASSQSEY